MVEQFAEMIGEFVLPAWTRADVHQQQKSVQAMRVFTFLFVNAVQDGP